MEVSANGRTLTLAHDGGGCRGEGRAGVRETEGSVVLTVLQQDLSEGADACTADLTISELPVRLRRPIGGRRIAGKGYGSLRHDVPLMRPAEKGVIRQVAPRLVGLSAEDARRALRGQALTAQFIGGDEGRVVAQAPAPRRRLQTSTMRLRVTR